MDPIQRKDTTSFRVLSMSLVCLHLILFSRSIRKLSDNKGKDGVSSISGGYIYMDKVSDLNRFPNRSRIAGCKVSG